MLDRPSLPGSPGAPGRPGKPLWPRSPCSPRPPVAPRPRLKRNEKSDRNRKRNIPSRPGKPGWPASPGAPLKKIRKRKLLHARMLDENWLTEHLVGPGYHHDQRHLEYHWQCHLRSNENRKWWWMTHEVVLFYIRTVFTRLTFRTWTSWHASISFRSL